ncbi:MAG: hypothetical protein ABEI27_04230 [Halobellus sp.]|uniref:hypothetical protein n=1 Tax=Halobellus sp. TaxID=1979212 RepID=UPI0035D4BFEC
MSSELGLKEVPGAIADYAAGVADAAGRGVIVLAVPILLVVALVLGIVGGGITLLFLAVVGPAIAAGIALEVPDRVRDYLD